MTTQTSTVATHTTPVTEKKPKERSPNYPAIGLRRAIELSQKLWECDKRQSVLTTRAAMNMGYSAKSSGGMLALAAMKKYGLLEDEGSGDVRKVKLSDTAIALLNPSSPSREPLLKQAALRPAIHAELWNKYGKEGASEGAIHDYLVFDRKFTEQAAKVLIDQYLDTIAFANLTNGDTIGEEKPKNDTEYQPPNPAAQLLQKPGFKPPTNLFSPPMNPSLRYLTIPLEIGDAPVPIGMSADDWDLFVKTLNLWKKKIVTSVKSPPEKTGEEDHAAEVLDSDS